jgi:membrane associated rhomboid family serine protease
MNWAHMAATTLLLLTVGSLVEPMMGTLRYAAFTVFASVLGVFGLAAVHPLGAKAIAGGSLQACTILGVWLACLSVAWRRRHAAWMLAIEIAAVASLAAWLALRTPTSNSTALMGLLWHAPSLMVGWFGFRLWSALQSDDARQSLPHRP